ncbi:PepSY domain-containing protein [Streptomyces halobius]|uniref:PepSY domain-containing protein n=1 Tax=Streptomyces halobius TaxID=2879846 RepID=A0ABY4MIJ7_9ACTN|nr:PepSY domain-containing protein [Streptomyces halobius]UQA97383.1 PepSY domain-containing protein [Streptomyces halobius]
MNAQPVCAEFSRRRLTSGRVITVVCAAAASALLLGCGNGAGETPRPTESPTPAATPTVSPTADPTLSADQADRKDLISATKIGYDKAAEAAVGKVSGSKLVDIELKYARDGGPEWATEVATTDGTAHTGRVDAVSGKVVESQLATHQGVDDERELADVLAKAKVSWKDAVGKALAKRKGTVTSVELGTENGTPTWIVDVVTTKDWLKTTFDVDAMNGTIRHEEVDRD